MKDNQIIKVFQDYLISGSELINKDNSQSKNLLKDIKEQLDAREENIPENIILVSMILAVIKDKNQTEENLQKLTNSYDEVLGLITHEFKNILTSIHGYNMLLEKRLTEDRDEESVHHLMDSDRLTRQLFDMTNSLLKMSLGEKGLLKPELKLIDFNQDLIEPLKSDLETQLYNKKMRIILKRPTKNMIVECDEGLLDIVIRNLLLNAIKYGKQKSDITVSISRSKKNFFVTIRNYNDDIPGDLCEGIFEKFKSRKVGREKGGTGIGLYNVKNIVQLHQGDITCKCLARKWIEFRFNIPQTI